jgi:hypothetical protein
MDSVETRRVLTSVAAQLDRFQDAFNRAFEVLALELPAVTDDLRTASRSMSELGDAQRDRGLGELLERVQRLADGVGRALTTLHRTQEETSSTLDRLRPAVDRLASSLGRIQQHADEIRKVALNASILVSKVGAVGAGFEVITHELISLSRQQLVEAEWALASNQKVHDQFDAVEDAGRALAAAVARSNASDLETARHDVGVALDRIGAAVLGEKAKLDELNGAIGRTMLEIQTQDIMRQGLDHVRLVVAEIIAEQDATAAGTSADDAGLERSVETYMFQRQSCDLSVKLLDEIGEDIMGLLASVEEQLERIQVVADDVGAIRGRAGAGHAIEHLERLQQQAAALMAAYGEGLELHQKGQSRLGDLARVVRPLVARLERVEEQQDTLKTLSLMVKLQTARSSELRSVATVASTLDEMHRQVVHADGDGSMAATARSVRALLRVEQRKEQSDVGHAHLMAMRGEFAEFEGAGRDTLAQLDRQVGAASKAGDTLRELAVRVRNEVSSLRRELEARSEIARTLQRIADEADRQRAQLEAQGAMPGGEVTSTRLSELIRRFTILSHKQLASSLDSEDMEDGDAGGELTLF